VRRYRQPATEGDRRRPEDHDDDAEAKVRRSPWSGRRPAEVAVKSRFLVYRNRVETETDVLVGKREDLLRRVDGGWKIARRKIVLDQSVLLTKNLTFFF